MDTSKGKAHPRHPVPVRLATPEDAERITIAINSAFRLVEEFFVDGDRIDAGSVLNLLRSGQFLLAESEGTLLGCVYVERRTFSVELSPGIQDSPPSEESELKNGVLNSQSTIRNPQFSRAYLGLLAVDPAHQQYGIGSALMDAAEDYCRVQGATFMDIKVVSLREGLFGFYRKRGYVETGTSPFPAEVETKVPCHFIDMSKPLN